MARKCNSDKMNIGSSRKEREEEVFEVLQPLYKESSVLPIKLQFVYQSNGFGGVVVRFDDSGRLSSHCNGKSTC